MGWCRWLLFFFLGCSSFVVMANSTDFSRVSVPVRDRSGEAFKQGVALGYAEVMTKLSGNPAIMTTPAIQNSLSQANHYLLKYSYKESANAASSETPLSLQMTFNQPALLHLLQKMGQSTLGQERPKTLVVLVMAHYGAFEILSSDDVEHAAMLKQLAARHGLPILLPIADLEDQALLASDLSEEGRASLMQRYQVSNILYGVAEQTNDLFEIRWQLWFDEAFNQWSSSGKSLQEVFDYGLDRLLETVADRYAVVKAPKLRSDVLLKIGGINGLEDYVRVVKTLKQLAPVNHIAVKAMTIDSLLLRINVNGGEEALRRSLQSAKNLVPNTSLSNRADSDVALYYQWQEPEALDLKNG